MHRETSLLFRHLLGLLVLLSFCHPAFGETRTWSARNGHRFDAELVAADALRATFAIGGKPKWVTPLADLIAPDAEIVRAWRSDPDAPLVDARLLAPWPAHAGAEAELQRIGETAGTYRFESASFQITSDVNLPFFVVRDLATVFEATRSVLIALPLGLHAAGEKRKYPVLLTGSSDTYTAAGGGAGSGGFFDSRRGRMVVLLPNLGIAEKNGKLQLGYANNLFVLKHEVTHQLLARWHGRLPFWLHEGLPEFIAALPYSRGRYVLHNPTGGLRDYLLKWRRAPNTRAISVIPPARLMSMTAGEWNRAVTQETAYDLYNSAGLLTCYFVQQRGGAPIAGFLEALRRGVDPTDAEKTHLLVGRTRESLAAELIAFGRRLGVEVKLAE
jgi:hypothetical protein